MWLLKLLLNIANLIAIVFIVASLDKADLLVELD